MATAIDPRVVPVVVAVVGVDVLTVAVDGAVVFRGRTAWRRVMAIVPRTTVTVVSVVVVTAISRGWGLRRRPPVLERNNPYAHEVPEAAYLIDGVGRGKRGSGMKTTCSSGMKRGCMHHAMTKNSLVVPGGVIRSVNPHISPGGAKDGLRDGRVSGVQWDAP